jgi:hypothetical protein
VEKMRVPLKKGAERAFLLGDFFAPVGDYTQTGASRKLNTDRKTSNRQEVKNKMFAISIFFLPEIMIAKA